MSGQGGYRWNKKPHVGHCTVIDMIPLHRALKHPGRGLTITWGQEQLHVIFRGTTMILEYGHTEQAIELETVPCHYGGTRQYFLCPDCGKRARKLYRLQQLFACRECQGLTYQSRVDVIGGTWAQIRAIERRLQCRYLHSRTRMKLFRRKEKLHWRILAIVGPGIDRMKKRIEALGERVDRGDNPTKHPI